MDARTVGLLSTVQDEREIRYLAWHIVNCIAATVAGVKPATIINLKKGRNRFFDLWNEFGGVLFNGSRISYCEFKKDSHSVVLFFYLRQRLCELFEVERIRKFFSALGYETDKGIENILLELKKRYNSNFFPHEIGVFLGIPLKDVEAFMGFKTLSYVKTSMWKIYGDSEESLKVEWRYKQAEKMIKKRLFCGGDPIRMINRKCWLSCLSSSKI